MFTDVYGWKWKEIEGAGLRFLTCCLWFWTKSQHNAYEQRPNRPYRNTPTQWQPLNSGCDSLNSDDKSCNLSHLSANALSSSHHFPNPLNNNQKNISATPHPPKSPSRIPHPRRRNKRRRRNSGGRILGLKKPFFRDAGLRQWTLNKTKGAFKNESWIIFLQHDNLNPVYYFANSENGRRQGWGNWLKGISRLSRERDHQFNSVSFRILSLYI